jgi:hypothetical protein
LAQIEGDFRLTTLAVEHKEEKKKTSEDIVGLNWEGSILALRLTAPDGTVIPEGFNNSSIMNIKGSNYEYYILKDVMPGNWTVEVVPIEVPPEGENFMLIKGQISRTKDMPSRNVSSKNVSSKDEPRLTTLAVEHKEEKQKTSEDIVGLNWEGSILALRLTAPDGTVIPEGFNNSSIMNIKGSNYEYYILKDVMPGNWTVEVVPVEVPPEGENFMLIKGQISGTKDMPSKNASSKDETRLTTMAAKTLLEKYQDSWIHGLTNACLQSLLRSF